MDSKEVMLETGRLILRPFHKEDGASCFTSFGQDQSLGNFLVMFPMKNVEEMENWVKAVSDNRNIWLVMEKKSGNPIGYVSIDIPYETLKIGEIAYFIGENYQRKGFAYEALRCVLEHLFRKRDLYLVEAKVNEHNTGSQKLLEKLGFVQEAKLRGRRIDVKTGERNALVVFSMVKEEFAGGEELVK